MNNSAKAALLIAAIIYFVWPIDLAPGIVIDDIIALCIGIAPYLKKQYDT